jgi:hypothetical protein
MRPDLPTLSPCSQNTNETPGFVVLLPLFASIFASRRSTPATSQGNRAQSADHPPEQNDDPGNPDNEGLEE